MREFYIERAFIKGMPHSVDIGLPGACEEVYNYALLIAKSYANLDYEIEKSKLCTTTEGGSTDSPDGVDMKDPNCGKPKSFEKATDESKFVKNFRASKQAYSDYLAKIKDNCSSGPLGNTKEIWSDLESIWENNIFIFREKFKTLGYEITTKDPLDDKPKSIADKVGDTLSSVFWGLGLLVGGFFVVDYVYEKAPSRYVGHQLAKRT